MAPWITVDTGLHNHPKMAALPNDSARWGWICVLVEAKQQRKPGTFASANHFRLVMGRHGRYLTDYINAKLLDKGDEGTLHVHDWRQHQWAVAKATQRGQEKDNNETPGGHQEDASRAVPVPVPVDVVSSTEGVQGEPDAAVSLHRRTGEVPGPKIIRWLTQLSDAHGEQRLAAMFDATPFGGADLVAYIKEVRGRLQLEDYAAEKAERKAEEERVAEKRRPIPIRAVEEPEISAEEADRIAREYMAQAKAMQ